MTSRGYKALIGSCSSRLTPGTNLKRNILARPSWPNSIWDLTVVQDFMQLSHMTSFWSIVTDLEASGEENQEECAFLGEEHCPKQDYVTHRIMTPDCCA